MKFQFPFPTLQHLASLRIAVHLANAKIGPYRRLPEAAWNWRSPGRLLAMDLEEIIEDWKILVPLKPMLTVVVTGVFHQLCQWLARLGRCMQHIGKWKEHFAANYQQMELVFDVHGRLDVTAVWGRFFVSKMVTTFEVEPLLELLEVAVFHQQLNHIDAILRKVMVIWNSRTELYGPSYTSSEGEILRMQYVFKKRHSQSTFRVLDSKFHYNTDSVFLGEHGITITFFGLMSVESFQKYYLSLNKNWKKIESVSEGAKNLSANSMRELIEGMNYAVVNEGMGKTAFKKLMSSFWSYQHVLRDFVVWPFAQFVFLPLFHDLRTKLRVSDYLVLFRAIIERMPPREEFGGYYNDIFLKFWNSIGAGMKTSLYHNLLKVNMACLRTLQRKNPWLHQRVVRELRALLEEELVELVE